MQVGQWSLYATRVVKTKGAPRNPCSYPAARTESLLELKGTRAWIVVPKNLLSLRLTWSCGSRF